MPLAKSRARTTKRKNLIIIPKQQKLLLNNFYIRMPSGVQEFATKPEWTRDYQHFKVWRLLYEPNALVLDKFVSILSIRRVLYVVCFLLGISPASEV